MFQTVGGAEVDAIRNAITIAVHVGSDRKGRRKRDRIVCEPHVIVRIVEDDNLDREPAAGAESMFDVPEVDVLLNPVVRAVVPLIPGDQYICDRDATVIGGSAIGQEYAQLTALVIVEVLHSTPEAQRHFAIDLRMVGAPKLVLIAVAFTHTRTALLDHDPRVAVHVRVIVPQVRTGRGR